MPTGGKRSKRSEVNLEKYLGKKKSIIRIRNEDELCLARALVVAKAKLDNDPRIGSLQVRIGSLKADANALGTGTSPKRWGASWSVRDWPSQNCSRRTWPIIRSISCRKSTTIISLTVVLRKTREFTSTCTTIIMTLSPRCLDSSLAATIATPARKPTVTTKNTCVRTSASVADFLPFVLKSPG